MCFRQSISETGNLTFNVAGPVVNFHLMTFQKVEQLGLGPIDRKSFTMRLQVEAGSRIVDEGRLGRRIQILAVLRPGRNIVIILHKYRSGGNQVPTHNTSKYNVLLVYCPYHDLYKTKKASIGFGTVLCNVTDPRKFSLGYGLLVILYPGSGTDQAIKGMMGILFEKCSQ
jgi:hypothetical protein